jgi:AAA domain
MSFQRRWRNIQLVFGERGCFKSTLFLALGKAVAAGEEFLEMKTKRRKVLYLDYENPANVIKARNDDLHLGLPNDDFKIWDRFAHGTPPKPGDPRLEERVKDCVMLTGYGPWLIFDSWSSLLGPNEGGELTGQTAYKFMELRRLADLGATITVIDHTRKYDRSTIYGGQDKEAKADSIHNLQLYDENRAHIVVSGTSWLKRHAPKNAGTFAFEVRGEQDRKENWHIREILRAENPEAEQERRHIELLRTIIRANPHAGQEEIAKLAAEQGLARDAAIKLLKAGARKHWTCETIGHNKFRYRVK